jgi:hypothetical protein
VETVKGSLSKIGTSNAAIVPNRTPESKRPFEIRRLRCRT